MTEIKELGSLCPVDDKGYIINQSDPKKVHNKFREVIQLINQSCLSYLPKETHSIYLRGSVARGLDIEGVSDVDVIIVTYSNPQDIDLDWVEETEQFIDQKFHFINGVELGFYPLSEVEESKYCSMIPFILKAYGICVYGKNLISKLPDYKPDSSLANEHLIHLSALIDKAKHELMGNNDMEDIKDCCSWIMRIMVRAGFALVIVQERSYTRDLFPAYKLFSKHYPEKESEMRTALWYAINPLSSSEEVLKLLNQFGSWIKAETEIWLNIYNPRRELHLQL
ncbi:nucleotidyltransferase domain-containing protein [Sediminibacillus halophilus]|uniref:Nucleotidyltransferase domain-containing protein n=1 Tax=Sediminibacillus halophilus TaxID=482461 RepID=A0A1G9P281_9BACI|nr:nucleotidyltransferase domain-containing protein [Sediminibacillus halophilus]SDL92721.1 Nucleotidyltransferase domain-containing protein [Sediminibacillus halophilus]